MFVDNVLRGAGNAPIYQGLALYRLLNDTNRVVLLCERKEEANRWLLTHRINKLDDLIDQTVIGRGEDKRLQQVEYCRSQGKVDFVVTGDIDLGKDLLEHGIDTFLFLHPMYIRPEFRPDGREGGPKHWKAIEEEVDRQLELYKEDPRT
jgi:hypothetical protein